MQDNVRGRSCDCSCARVGRGDCRRPHAIRGARAWRTGWQGAYVGANLGYQWSGGEQQRRRSLRRRGRRAARLQLAVSGNSCSAARPICSCRDADDTLRRLEILQSLVRHVARPRRLRDEQHPVLRNRRASPTARLTMQNTGTGVTEIAHQRRLGRRRRHRDRADGQLERQSGISLRRSRRPHVRPDGANHGIESNILRFGVNYRF